LSGSTTLDVDSMTNWSSDFIGTYGTPDGNGSVIPSSVRVFYGEISGSDINITGFAPGYTDNGNSVGDIVVIKPTTAWADELAEFLNVSHDADGSLTNGIVVTAKLADEAVTADKIDFTTLSGTTTQWRTWTPTLTNFTGTVNVAKYTLIGKFCFFYIKVTQGGSVTGNHVFSLPIAVNTDQAFTAPINTLNTSGYIYDLGAAQYPAHAQLNSSTTLGLLVTSAGGVYTAPTATSPTVPMTWSSGNDSFYLSGWYETV